MSRISVVVLTRDCGRSLGHTLSQLTTLNPGVPIVVVDNADAADAVDDDPAQPTSRAADIAGRFPHVTVIRCAAEAGAAVARNAGVARVRTEYVAFCTDDGWWEAGALRNAQWIMDTNPGVAVLSAKVLIGDDGRTDAACDVMARSPLDATGLPGPALTAYCAEAAVFRTRAFHEVGGYSPRLLVGGGEELVALDLLTRGWHLAYAPMLAVRHGGRDPADAAVDRLAPSRSATNAVWVACMRLPAATVWRRLAAAVATMLHDGTLLDCGWDTLRGMPSALRERRRIPERVRRMVEQVRRGSRVTA